MGVGRGDGVCFQSEHALLSDAQHLCYSLLAKRHHGFDDVLRYKLKKRVDV